ncbi:DUF485 domain-containing protein [Deferribacter thermophilus]|uniref:DUF485 domain-containing protein n=1 Tax=Deferribacter thermophilus TaxID=53573 RepID=UPI003C257365
MIEAHNNVLKSEKFKNLIRKRWTFSYFMLLVLFLIYYGYIFLIALNKEFMAKKVGVYTNVGIIMAVGVIFAAWILTYIYVIWANNVYDKEVEELKKGLE